MDSFTHVVIGAAVGEIFAGKKLGRKALLWGMVAQSLPDIDFVASFWMPTSANLLAHRGFTHSILFAAIATFFCALISERWHRKHDISLRYWMLFWGVQIMIHLFLDSLNAYGIGWFEPFSHMRISFNVIFVADPFFSIWTALALVFVFLFHRHRRKTQWAIIALSVSAIYLVYCVSNKMKAERAAKAALYAQHIGYKRHFTTPTMFNNWLWYIVAQSDSGCYTGYYSVFSKTGNIKFHFHPQNERLLAAVQGRAEEIQQLKRFSQGYYTVEQWGDTLVFNDLRFGQIAGWSDSNARFVFHYYLQPPADNKIVVQRGRAAAWNKRDIASLISSIKGN